MAIHASSILTPAHDPELQAQLAAAYRAMEGPLEDIRRASILLETMHDDAMKPLSAEHGLRTYEGNVLYSLTEDQRDGLGYAVIQVGDLARALVKRFHAVMTGKTP